MNEVDDEATTPPVEPASTETAPDNASQEQTLTEPASEGEGTAPDPTPESVPDDKEEVEDLIIED